MATSLEFVLQGAERFTETIALGVGWLSIFDVLSCNLTLFTLGQVLAALGSAHETGASNTCRSLPQFVFAVFVGGLGGGTLRQIMLGEPVSWVQDDTLIPIYVLMALLFRLKAVNQWVQAPGVQLILSVCADLTTMCCVCSGAICAADALHGGPRNTIFAAVICGFSTARGGGICCDTFSLASDRWTLKTPSILRNPNASHLIPVLLPLFFALTTNPHHLGLTEALLSRSRARLFCGIATISFGTVATYWNASRQKIHVAASQRSRSRSPARAR